MFARVLCLAVLLISLPAAAQQEKYTPGQKIDYKVSSQPDVWEQGVYLRPTADGTQPIIRRKPSTYFPEGDEIAYSWDRIRPHVAKPDPQPNKPKDPPKNPAPATNGKGLMSKADVIAFLKARLGADPLTNPRRDEIKAELAEEIKRRGLSFRYEVLDNAFRNEMYKLVTMTSEITFPLGANFGPPTPQNWLMGSWKLNKIGAPVRFVRDGKVYEQLEMGVANVGKLVLAAGGTYTWTPTGAKPITGKWRAATAAEMKHQGGQGVVLLKAKSGWDWIVQQDRETTLPGNHVWISELTSRQVREAGVK